MAYEGIELKEELRIEKVVTVHYFEYMNDFCFPGEVHDFWEFQCVDKGEVLVQGKTIKAGQMIFHRPNEFHDLSANGEIAPNVAVVSFESHSEAMEFFEGKILEITEQERTLIGLIISEARRCIASPLDDPGLQKMERRAQAPFGSEQMIRICLEALLIGLIRRNRPGESLPDRQLFGNGEGANGLYGKILEYLESHIRDYVTVEDICRENGIGRAQLQRLFRERHHSGVIDFFARMKVEYAKQLIREQNQNFTQISEFLGYSSIHYFSRQFKKITGMTPSEYIASIKARSEQS